MTGKQLKNSILQWAIQGKLVPQDPNDEPASVLLEKIRAEKARLIKEGKIKKDKKESIIYRGEDNSYYEKFADGKVVCIDEEIPFKIPSTWEWCRLSSLFQINPKNTVEDNADAAFIPMEKIDATYQSSFSYYVRKWREIKSGFTHFADGDVAFAKITPCFQNRKSMILKGLPNGIGAGTTELKVLRTYGNTISTEYLLFFLESPYFVEEAIFKGTANQQRIISGYLENKLFPIPPQKEQQRIVDIINASFTVAETYSKAQKKLDSLNNSLAASLRKSILQEAIQGKLVPQEPNEESASILLQRIKEEKQRLVKEGKLKKKDVIDSTIFRGDDNKYYEQIGTHRIDITDSIPFDIPVNWSWCRIDDYVELVTDFVASGSFASLRENVKYYKTPNYAILVKAQDFQYDFQKDLTYTDRHGYDFLAGSNLFGGELILSNVGSIGKVFIVPKLDVRMSLAPNSIMVKPIYENQIKWLYYLFNSEFGVQLLHSISSATAIRKFNKTSFKKLIIPIPPTKEQKRIVKKIETVFDRIKGD